METPISSNGYFKYVVQTGWFSTTPGFIIALFGQDILSKSQKDAEYLLSILYPEINKGIPCLCPIVDEIKADEIENLDFDIEQTYIKAGKKSNVPLTPKNYLSTSILNPN